ncbi:hypothetical protein D3C77_572110 [compost metagenome]
MCQRRYVRYRSAIRHKDSRLLAYRQRGTEASWTFAWTVLRFNPAPVESLRRKLGQLWTKAAELLYNLIRSVLVRNFACGLPKRSIHIAPA